MNALMRAWHSVVDQCVAVLVWMRARQKSAEPAPTPAVTPPDEKAARPPAISPGNRKTRRRRDAERRKYEKERRRFDKFVEPQGLRLVKSERDEPLAPKPERKPKAAVDEPVAEDETADPNDPLIVGEWLQGDGTEVLYEQSEFYGEFNFRDTILDQLERYWVYLDRMRKRDHGAYGFYKQVGATLLPYAATDSFADKPDTAKFKIDLADYKRQIVLPPWFKTHWPAFGCCAWGANPRDEARELVQIEGGFHLATPRFIYYRRVKKFPWTVQPVHGGKLYTMTVWWDHTERVGRYRQKWGVPQEFAVRISDDGEKIRVLKTREGPDGRIRPEWDWRIPSCFTEWSQDYGLRAETHLSYLFCSAAKHNEYAAYSMLRIEVENKNGLTAVFGLSPRRTSYFFQDRDITLDHNGVSKRIFHMVRPFVRSDGVAVPAHFRGLRDFTWAGYQVHITVPGLDHFMPSEFNVPATFYETKGRLPKSLLTEPKVGKMLKDQMREGYGRAIV